MFLPRGKKYVPGDLGRFDETSLVNNVIKIATLEMSFQKEKPS